jgi:hypothetical protein
MSLEQVSRDIELCSQTVKKMFTEQAEAHVGKKYGITSSI